MEWNGTWQWSKPNLPPGMAEAVLALELAARQTMGGGSSKRSGMGKLIDLKDRPSSPAHESSSSSSLSAPEPDQRSLSSSGGFRGVVPRSATASPDTSLAAARSPNTFESFATLNALLCKNDLALYSAICERGVWTDTQNPAIEPMVAVLASAHRMHDVIVRVVRRELETVKQESCLFRAASSGMHILSAFAKITGLSYLYSEIRPVVQLVMASSASFEIENDRLPAASTTNTANVNAINLANVCKDLLHAINHSIERCPVPLWRACQIIGDVVAERFPDSALQGVGAVFFLRFICPAIVLPETYGMLPSEGLNCKDLHSPLSLTLTLPKHETHCCWLGSSLETPNALQRRRLTLVSKVLQSLVNASHKDIHPVLASFLAENAATMKHIQVRLAVRTACLPARSGTRVAARTHSCMAADRTSGAYRGPCFFLHCTKPHARDMQQAASMPVL